MFNNSYITLPGATIICFLIACIFMYQTGKAVIMLRMFADEYNRRLVEYRKYFGTEHYYNYMRVKKKLFIKISLLLLFLLLTALFSAFTVVLLTISMNN